MPVSPPESSEVGFSVFTFFITYQKFDVLLSSSHSVYQMVLKHYLVAIAINRKAISYISIDVINYSVLPNTLASGPNTQALDSFCLPPLLCFFVPSLKPSVSLISK